MGTNPETRFLGETGFLSSVSKPVCSGKTLEKCAHKMRGPVAHTLKWWLDVQAMVDFTATHLSANQWATGWPTGSHFGRRGSITSANPALAPDTSPARRC